MRPPAARHVHAQVHEQHERRQHMPPDVANGIPVSLRMVTIAYSIGRVAMPLGSRPASTQPMSMAATGMAIRMRNRLSHGT